MHFKGWGLRMVVEHWGLGHEAAAIVNSYRFEGLAGRILKHGGFTVDVERSFPGSGLGRFEADIVLTYDDVVTVAEVKVYRSRNPGPRLFAKVLDSVRRLRYASGAAHAAVICNARRANLPIAAAKDIGVHILAIEDLLALASSNPSLESELLEVDRELSSALGAFDDGLTLPEVGIPEAVAVLMRPWDGEVRHDDASEAQVIPAAVELPGARLIRELRSIPPGKDTGVTTSEGRQNTAWRLFEIVCYDAVKYLFDEQFHSWKDQESVGGDASRFDVIAKVKGTDVFSRMLIEDFQSRYVVFEFKNYGKPLKANLVYVTEKYLFPKALRGTAIFFSPQGMAQDALEAAQGALRDAGKLMLSIDVETLCTMLFEKDQGTDPGFRMEGLLDNFLQALGR